MVKPPLIFGIDFSGARDAGNRIWIASGVPEGDVLFIQDCFSAGDLLNSGKRLESCLPALVNLIQSNRNAAFGFDFPFALPDFLVQENNWNEFVLAFLNRFKSAGDFKGKCFSEAGSRELWRFTDKEAHTPFSPYNLRLYKQTYYGISKILFPIVRDRIACVVPFHKPVCEKPWILEICPASTLKDLGISGNPYKGRNDCHKKNRWKILHAIERIGQLQFKQSEIRHIIIENNGGDALDSVIAAMAVFNAVWKKNLLIPDDNGHWKIEGYVYV